VAENSRLPIEGIDLHEGVNEVAEVDFIACSLENMG